MTPAPGAAEGDGVRREMAHLFVGIVIGLMLASALITIGVAPWFVGGVAAAVSAGLFWRSRRASAEGGGDG